MGGWGIVPSFLTSALDLAALPLGEDLSVLTEYEFGWAPAPVLAPWNREEFLVPVGKRTWAVQPVVCRCADGAILALISNCIDNIFISFRCVLWAGKAKIVWIEVAVCAALRWNITGSSKYMHSSLCVLSSWAGFCRPCSLCPVDLTAYYQSVRMGEINR
jgi:hypothetical protein